MSQVMSDLYCQVVKRLFLAMVLFFILGLPALAQSTEQFLTLSDLHFDPFLSCHEKPCPLIENLRTKPVTEWRAIFSSQDRSVPTYGKDSNYSLLTSSLLAAQKEGKAANIRFVLVLGDLLAHDYDQKYFQYAGDKTQAGYARFVNKTLAFLATE